MRRHLRKALPVLFLVLSMAALSGCDGELGQKMGNAAMNTLMGMGVVFLVLILISFVISGFSLINKAQARKTTKEVLEPASPAPVPVQEEPEEEEELTDDLELVAVIAAAIAASENTSPDGLVVRSIRRVSSRNQWKRG